MSTKAQYAPLVFIIDDEVAAYIKLKDDLKHDRVPKNVQKLIDDGGFDKAVKNKDLTLDQELYFERNEAAEIMEENYMGFYIASNFFGDVVYLDKKLQRIYAESYTNGYIVFLRPSRDMDFFKAAYDNIDEIIEEFKKALSPVGAFPPDFDWASKLVEISIFIDDED